MQGWKRALEPLNSFPFNFFCFARNSAKFPPFPALALPLFSNLPRFAALKLLPRRLFRRRTASCTLAVYGALCKWKFGCSHLGGQGREIAERPSTRQSLPPSLLPFVPIGN